MGLQAQSLCDGRARGSKDIRKPLFGVWPKSYDGEGSGGCGFAVRYGSSWHVMYPWSSVDGVYVFRSDRRRACELVHYGKGQSLHCSPPSVYS
jgi:hypothetical protein